MQNTKEQQSAELKVAKKKLTPEIMHEFIEKIVVHAPDKSSGHRTQRIDIYFRFNVLAATVTADSMVYDK